MWIRKYKISAIVATALVLALASTASALHAQSVQPVQTDELESILIKRGFLRKIGGQIVSVGQTVTQTVVEQVNQVGEHTNNLVGTAISFIGIPYQLGGSSAATGFDCSGFIRAIYKDAAGFVLPRSADQQANATKKIEKNELKPGDLVFFNTMKRTFSHVGMYLGEGKFIHSPRSGASVRIEDMRIPYWNVRFDGARRVQSEALDASVIQTLKSTDTSAR